MKDIGQNLQLLKNKIFNLNIKLSDLLREAKIVAYNLKNSEFLKWLENELDGYKDRNKIPNYRKIQGEPHAFNPYRGWIPLRISDPKIQELLSCGWLDQSIPQLEYLIDKVSNTNNLLQITYPPEVQNILYQLTGVETMFIQVIHPVSIVGILECVRNKLLDWIIKLSSEKGYAISTLNTLKQIFPEELIKKLPTELKILCDDFNFNFLNNRPVACMLILRRLLPLAIVRKFQRIKKEKEIKNDKGEYFETEKLVNKAEGVISNKRVVKEIKNYKFLIDVAQHSYSINIYQEDVEGAAIKIRVFLNELFEDKKDEN